MPGEEAHEIGRRGVLNAKNLLWRLLGDSINLPFNAYDHGPKLTFNDLPNEEGRTFAFDLGGVLQRRNPARLSGQDAIEVFVEVKYPQYGDGLLQEYCEFLRRAAVVSLTNRHRDSWFIFLAGVPFGSTKGVELCNGVLLQTCRDDWPEVLKASSGDLHSRVCVFIATASLERLLTHWVVNA